MKLSPYPAFNGDCEAAFRFYEQTLGGKITEMVRYAGSPMQDQVPAEMQEKVMHARIQIGDRILMGSDAPPGRYEKPSGFSISLETSDEAEADKVFATLAEGGTVHMPIQKTFWARRFGMLADRFGIPWMVNCE
jgi:PhnB protein